ncbi:hypothetical protein FYK55_28080 [Roseiconus nitratireducens]|uniref:Uncharacterized protein n=1 Tax=Roseiconus nitratireducens TaxID=2605748 RepID=A0A5M6CRX1_9BACT|nr:hypothetical protein [Roseiconus nitratireducens]KAA5537944.1 hypothetical protein FYK55_28080 [Roseiconus nitratireducens]
MMSQKPNPYLPRSPKQSSASDSDATGPASLHRGLCLLVSLLYSAIVTAFLALAVGLVIELTTLGDQLGLDGVPGMAVIFVVLVSAPAGLVGGLVCGLSRGERLGRSIALGLATLAATLMLLPGGELPSITEIVRPFAALSLPTVGSVLICHAAIRRIRQRRQSARPGNGSDDRHPPENGWGRKRALVVTGCLAVAAVICLACATWPERRPELSVGSLALSTLATLAGLYVAAAYPGQMRPAVFWIILSAVTATFSMLWLLGLG